MMTTTAATYDNDLAEASELLTKRLSKAIGSDDFLARELPKSLSDALGNTWTEGLTVAEWAKLAAKRVSI